MIAGRANVALIGFMASGKTSVGRALSALTHMPFADVDEQVERREGRSVAEIFAERGEPYFRERESEVLEALCEEEGWILGCGGGTLLDPRNRLRIQARCVAVWLRASSDELLRRLESRPEQTRPLLAGRDPRIVVPGLLQAREGLYGEAALTVETEGRTVASIAEELAIQLGLPLLGSP
ncbi:MAG: shikimate kinase [Candidatus Eisenbacteria bacterium]|nr:shikimate kinase [Candidatus Eisenbacteria bacterium]